MFNRCKFTAEIVVLLPNGMGGAGRAGKNIKVCVCDPIQIFVQFSNSMASPPSLDSPLYNSVIDAANSMNKLGINQGTSGNVSVRCPGGFLITPSGVPYESLTPGDIPFVEIPEEASDDTYFQGLKAPSSEWKVHRDMYNTFASANSIVHTHSPFATGLSCLRKAIPAFHYMVGVCGGKCIPCAEYGTFGMQSLSDNIINAMQTHETTGCLMANHGVIVYGKGSDARKTVGVAVEVENLAKQYHVARSFGLGEPTVLDDAEMKVILAKFKTYGKSDVDVACLCEFDQLNRIVNPVRR